jgi:RNA polymerase sigma-70 factor, ECF subfamily
MPADLGSDSDDAVRSRVDEAPSDRMLLQQYRHGDQDAARQLYQRYAHRLRGLARSRRAPDLAGRVDDDDIIQSVFGSFFRGVIRGAYDVPAGEELWNLLLVITLNKIRAKGVFHRAAKRNVRQTTGDVHFHDYVDALESDSQACTLLQISVREALDRLPPEHKRVIELRMEGYEVTEIAGIIGRAKRSVERNLQEGRQRLGKLLLEDR